MENEDLQPTDKTGVLKIGLQQSFYMPQVNQAKKITIGNKQNISNTTRK